MPWGESVTGILLESLRGASSTLYAFCKRQREAGAFRKVEEVDELVRLLFSWFSLY